MCRNASRPKCFSCGQTGHKANECVNKTKVANSNLIVDDQEPTVSIHIGNCVLYSLFDSGCYFNLITKAAFLKIGAPPVKNLVVELHGFGGKRTRAEGRISTDVFINSQFYREVPFSSYPMVQ